MRQGTSPRSGLPDNRTSSRSALVPTPAAVTPSLKAPRGKIGRIAIGWMNPPDFPWPATRFGWLTDFDQFSADKGKALKFVVRADTRPRVDRGSPVILQLLVSLSAWVWASNLNSCSRNLHTRTSLQVGTLAWTHVHQRPFETQQDASCEFHWSPTVGDTLPTHLVDSVEVWPFPMPLLLYHPTSRKDPRA